MEQYRLIIDLCGSPDVELLKKIEEQNSPAMRLVVERMSKREETGSPCVRRNFHEVFAQFNIPIEAVDLLDHILVLDPDRRFGLFGFKKGGSLKNHRKHQSGSPFLHNHIALILRIF